jgi:hypothetical protein
LYDASHFHANLIPCSSATLSSRSGPAAFLVSFFDGLLVHHKYIAPISDLKDDSLRLSSECNSAWVVRQYFGWEVPAHLHAALSVLRTQPPAKHRPLDHDGDTCPGYQEPSKELRLSKLSLAEFDFQSVLGLKSPLLW